MNVTGYEWILTPLSMLCVLILMPRTFFNCFNLPQQLAMGLLSTLGIMVGALSGVAPTSAPTIPIYLFLAYLFLTGFWSFPPHNFKKEVGLQFTLISLFFITVAFLPVDKVLWVLGTAALILGLNALYARGQNLGIDLIFPNEKKGGGPTTNSIGTIGNPNYLASFYCGCLWLGIAATVYVSHYLLLVVAFGLWGLYKTHSRAGQIGFLGSVVFFVLILAKNRLFGMRASDLLDVNGFLYNLGIALVLLISIFFVIILLDNWETFWRKPIDPKGPQVWYASFRYRLCYWLSALWMIKEKPFFGHGLWGYRRGVYRAQAELNDRLPGFMNEDRYITPQPRECHNDYLEHLVEYGIVGTLIFFAFVVGVYWVGFRSFDENPLLLAFLLSNLTAILIDAIFFFPLRLPSTGLLFWITCALVLVVSGRGGVSQIVAPSYWNLLFVGFFLIPFLWECVVKRGAASYYFAKFRSLGDEEKKVKYLSKAIETAPLDSIYRTHACIGSMDWEPTMGNLHAGVLHHFYDGQTPLGITLYNIALARLRSLGKIYDEINYLLKLSHWVLPYFPPTLHLLNNPQGVGVRSMYKGGNTNVRIAEESVSWKVKALVEASRNLGLEQEKLQKEGKIDPLVMENFALKNKIFELDIQVTLERERRRLNIPDTWAYKVEDGQFISPMEA